MHRQLHHYTFQSPSQHAGTVDRGHGSGRHLSRMVHPSAPRSNNVPLPPLLNRPSPLVDRELSLPPVPFVMILHDLLKWGGWRKLPPLHNSHRRRTFTNDALLAPATSLEVGELVMVVNCRDVRYEVLIRPRRADVTFVSVLDVVEAAKEEVRGAVRGGFSNGEQSIRRNSDGTWDWRGVQVVEYEDGSYVLWLDV